jgi:O-antigen/teichoic acid export membrane protein
MAGLLIATLSIFIVVRRYSLAHPDVLNTFVIDREVFEKNEAGTDWENIGFHRTLGGFMFAVMTGLVLFIPMMIYQNLILPSYILPSAQAMGIWGRVAAFFPIVWNVFDMGTSVAHIKFFAQYRVHNPQRAIQYAQFFVWWQTLTGAVQVALVVALSGAFLPNSIYAMYIWAIIAHTLIQIPGFYMIISDSLTSLQRTDYNQLLDVTSQMVIPMLTQPVVITLFVWWGKNNPVFGFAMGGVLGLGAAAYASALISFLFGLWLYRRIGYNARLLFLAHFDWNIAKESLKLGVFLVLSGLIGGLASSLQVLLIQSRLINTNEVLGNLGLASSFGFAYSVILTLTGNAMPAISEAISNGRKILGQYYAAAAYKYGGMVSAFICAMLLAVADRFILGSSGIEFERAATYAIPLLIGGSLTFATWIGDIVMYATKKTMFVTLLATLDFCVGLGGAFLLVDRFQVYALIAVPYITTTIRMLLVYYLNNRFCFPQKYYFWQSAIAPILAGIAHYLVLRWVTELIWRRDELTSILILLIAMLPAYPLYAFFYGLMGGWDQNTLAEFSRGTKLSGFARPMARLFYRATELGARISPLHNRFPITIFEPAMAEADSLTKEKVSFLQD